MIRHIHAYEPLRFCKFYEYTAPTFEHIRPEHRAAVALLDAVYVHGARTITITDVGTKYVNTGHYWIKL